MAKPVCFGVYRFKSKKDGTEDIRSRLIQYEAGQELGEEDFSFFMSLFTLHDEFDEKIGTGVSHINVERDFHNNKCLFLHRTDDRKVSISWVHCLRPYNNKTTVSSAFRRSVKERIMKFKSHALENHAVCPVNKSPLNYTNSHVVYVRSSFSELLEEFMRNENLSFDDVIIIDPCSSDIDQRGILSDKLLEKSWLDHHAFNAKLELWSDIANMSKKTIRI